jgi:hypothetical protein
MALDSLAVLPCGALIPAFLAAVLEPAQQALVLHLTLTEMPSLLSALANLGVAAL